MAAHSQNSQKYMQAEETSLPKGYPHFFLTPAILAPCLALNQALRTHLVT